MRRSPVEALVQLGDLQSGGTVDLAVDGLVLVRSDPLASYLVVPGTDARVDLCPLHGCCVAALEPIRVLVSTQTVQKYIC